MLHIQTLTMKKLIILPLLLISIGLSSQSASLSTFEEMWIVSPEFMNLDVKSSVSLAPESMTYEQFNAIKSFEDLNKIIADTPFLSLTLGKPEEATEPKGIEANLQMITLADRLEIGKKQESWGNWMVLFKSGEDYVIGMPTKQPEDLKAYLEKNKVMISDKMGNFSNMSIKEIRIENGTY